MAALLMCRPNNNLRCSGLLCSFRMRLRSRLRLISRSLRIREGRASFPRASMVLARFHLRSLLLHRSRLRDLQVAQALTVLLEVAILTNSSHLTPTNTRPTTFTPNIQTTATEATPPSPNILILPTTKCSLLMDRLQVVLEGRPRSLSNLIMPTRYCL